MLSRPEQRDFIDEGSCDGQQRSLSHCEYTYTCFIVLIELTILTVLIMLEMCKYFSAKLIGIMVLIILPVCPPFVTLHVRGMEAGETGERIDTISFCPSLKNQPHMLNMVAVLNNQRQYWVEQARQGQD